MISTLAESLTAENLEAAPVLDGYEVYLREDGELEVAIGPSHELNASSSIGDTARSLLLLNASPLQTTRQAPAIALGSCFGVW